MRGTFLEASDKARDLPYTEIPVIGLPAGGAAGLSARAREDPRDRLNRFFSAPHVFVELRVVPEGRDGGEYRLAELIENRAGGDRGVAVVGRSGSGKTVTAAHAFRTLQSREGVRPIWLPRLSAPNPHAVGDPWNLFVHWVARSTAPAGQEERWAERIPDWLAWCPVRLVFIADLAAFSYRAGAYAAAVAEAVTRFRDAGSANRPGHTCVILVRTKGELAGHAGAFDIYQMAPPGKDFQERRGIAPAVWDELRGRFGDDLTPLVLAIAPPKGPVPPVGQLLGEIAHQHMAADLTPPPRVLEGLPSDCRVQLLDEWLAVYAVRLLAESVAPEPRATAQPDEPPTRVFGSQHSPEWFHRVGIEPRAEHALYFIDLAKRSRVDELVSMLKVVLGVRLLTQPEDSEREPEFIHTAFLHYYAGAEGLSRLFRVTQAVWSDLLWRTLAVAPAAWLPALEYYASRLQPNDLAVVLGQILFSPPEPANRLRAQLGRQLLSGRARVTAPAAATHAAPTDVGLECIRDELGRYVAYSWPEALYGLCRAATAAVCIPTYKWVADAARQRDRLEVFASTSETDTRPDPVHARPVVRVVGSGRWVCSVGAGGDLVAHDRVTGRVEKPAFGDRGRVTAVDVRAGGVVIGTSAGRVLGWLPGTGDPIGWYSYCSGVVSIACGRDGRVLVGHADGRVFTVDPGSGRPAQAAMLDGPVRCLVPLDGGRFGVVATDGIGVSVRNGSELLWESDPAPPGERSAVSVLLALTPHVVLVGRQDGRVGVCREEGDWTLTDLPARPALTPVVGLAAGPTGVFTSDLAGRVHRIGLPDGVARPTDRVAAGRLGWYENDLILGETTGGVRKVDLCADLNSGRGTEERAVAGFARLRDGLLLAVSRNGEVRHWPVPASDVAPDPFAPVGQAYELPGRVISTTSSLDGGLQARLATGHVFSWSGAGDVRRSPSPSDEPIQPLPADLDCELGGRHLGGRHADRCPGASRWASGGGDGVIAVWGEPAGDGPRAVLAAYVAPAAVSCVRWLDSNRLAAGLVTGGVLVLTLYTGCSTR